VNLEETGKLVGHMALYDNRRTSDPDTLAWYQVIGDLPYDDAKAAVIGHYAESTDRIMPAHVRTRVKAMRRARLEHGIAAAPSPEIADDARDYQEVLRSGIRQLANGYQPERLAIAAPVREGPPPEVFTEARAALGPSLRDRNPQPMTAQEIARQQAAASRAERAGRGDPMPEAGVA
jgi:hypothetical protein